MPRNRMNREWYGNKAKIIEEDPDYTVVDYGCVGRGLVIAYPLFEGIQLCFLDFDTEESLHSQKFNPDIIQITYCKSGRYECGFSNHTVSYLSEGYLGIAGTKYLPVSFSFPLKKCYAISLVIDRQTLTREVSQNMNMMSISIDKIGIDLGINKSWYCNLAPKKIQQLFHDLEEAKGKEKSGYFRIKAMELLYYIQQLTTNCECESKYYDIEQIQNTKKIRDFLVTHYEERGALDKIVKEYHMNLTQFHAIFSQIYGDTPYGYVKNYKMNIAAINLLENRKKIGQIAAELGYSNASKFAKAFYSVYGVLPKDYRKMK